MKSRYLSNKIIFITIFCSIAILGISYSRWINTSYIFASLTTGSLDYEFNDNSYNLYIVHSNGATEPVPAKIEIVNEKQLNIDLLDTSFINKMTMQDKLQLQYQLKGNKNNNIALKTVDGYIGDYSFTLDPSSVSCSYNGTQVSAAGYMDLAPPSLGTFQVYHNFSKSTGYIDLYPVNIMCVDNVILNESRLPSEISDNSEDKSGVSAGSENKDNQLVKSEAKDNNLNSNELAEDDIKYTEKKEDEASDINNIDNSSANGNDVTSEENINDKDKTIAKSGDNNKKDEVKNKKSKKMKLVTTKIGEIKVQANYYINIPLKYDQHNAK